MTCDERRDLLLLYVIDGLDPAERDALRDHLATGCPTCVASLAEAEAVVAHMAQAVDPIALPAGAADRLMARIGSPQQPDVAGRIVPTSNDDDDGATTLHRESPSRRRWPVIASLLTAAASIALTAAAMLFLTRDARTFWRSTNLLTVNLASETQPSARAQLWWDRDHQTGRVIVAGANPTAAGREYELWFIPAGGKPIRSQTFTVDARGAASIVVPVPASVGTDAVAAITDEPLGGSDAPTGTIHLAGKLP